MEKLFHIEFLIFLCFRLSSVLVIQTSYVPDEYWQSLEVAHNMIFGYGYLTWEWTQGLRSYLYPLFFSFFYKTLHLLKLDFAFLLILVPKVAQSILTAVSDQYFLLTCRKFGFDNYWSQVVIFTNWFWYYCGSRTVINTLETSLIIIALYYYPWDLFSAKTKDHIKDIDKIWTKLKKKTLIYFTIASTVCTVRITAITIWGPLVLLEICSLNLKYVRNLILECFLPVAFVVLSLSLLIDCLWYGKFIFPAFNFLFFNVFKEISSFYGTHPFYWYITSGLPVVLGFHYFTFTLGLFSTLRSQTKETVNKFRNAFAVLIFIIFLNVIILSNIPHKEFRFVLPLSPLMMLIVVKFSTEFFTPSRKKLKFLWTIVLVTGFLVPNILFGTIHQRGTLNVMGYLRSSIANCSSKCFFLFLMPCHSTPLYSHLHVNVTTRFLTCEPPLTEGSFDESEHFFKNPNEWLKVNWNDKNIPSHVVFFDSAENSLSSFLIGKGFERKCEFLHTIFAEKNSGRYILVYEPTFKMK